MAGNREMGSLGRYVATELRFELGRYAANARSLCSDRAPARSLCSDRAPARARSLRSELAERTLGRYVATELWLELGCYATTERNTCSVAA
ncbi:hypothetical protein F2Q68_00025381 [Brassica cretica]|uniref:Uncharacterized protein n=1 Tax=Brassica cretica TaxID=69181 RepID=A0A8S9IHK8_BRACR|nr:hypothetical protein F2Q68_00025381 [Brassica cretica]